MDVLILGGTHFLGRALVDALVAGGDAVTLVHRGVAAAGLPGTTSIVFDRNDGHALLAGKRWDAVIDCSGMQPHVVADAAQALAECVSLYCFISTISVYRDGVEPIDERSPVVDVPHDMPPDVTGATYGPKKVLCERAVEATFGERALIVRPGLIVGPYDRSDRFTYWVRRIAAGGTIAAPGRPERTVQFIDVRDVAEWVVRAARARLGGTFNATGPAAPLAMRTVLDACANVARTTPRFVWISDSDLLAAGVGPWMEMPLWIPDSEDAMIRAVDCRKAIAAGLAFRQLDDTVAATLAWDRTRSREVALQAGLASDREAALLAVRT
jgi:2'-hydroxyisoflavone reductase